MDNNEISKRLDSEHRDSEFFSWQEEDIDCEDPLDSPQDKHSIYSFNSHPSLLIEDKGYTKRGDREALRQSKTVKLSDKSLFRKPDSLIINSLRSISIDRGYDKNGKHEFHSFNKDRDCKPS